MDRSVRVIETREDLAPILRTDAAGVHVIKPRIAFKLVEQTFQAPADLSLQIPSSGIGSVTMLEAALIVAMLRLVKPERIFEFGTFLGYTTATLARNSAFGSTVYSLDIGATGLEFQHAKAYGDVDLHTDDKKNDDYLRFVQANSGPYYLSSLKREDTSRVRLLTGDSRKFDIDAHGLRGNVGFVFIDGGHESNIVASDTEKAFAMVGSSGVIFWHDYASTIHHDVTDVVGELSVKRPILHFQHTMLAMCVLGAAKELFSGD